MTSVFVLIFTLATALILHTYLIYPFLMILFFSKKKKISTYFERNDVELPSVAVLIAAYNEEKVIKEKLESVFNTNYPKNKLKIYVGSDASDDGTNELLNKLKIIYSNLEFVIFEHRSGKINIINHLQSLSDEEILIMTDANVMFKTETLFELIKNFKDEQVGIVASNIIKVSQNNEGISYQEKMYLSLENKIKEAESNAFNLIMGAEGGCYAIRNNLFSKVPSKFIVDDFFITIQVLLKGKKVLFNTEALCTEDVDSAIKGEYRRKVRISSGNFQNLFFFKGLLYKFWKPIGFAFWSHKVLRWLTPFFLFFVFVTSACLALSSNLFLIIFLFQLSCLFITFFSGLISISNPLLKFIVHFYLMNFALFEGFVKYCKGIQSSVWQPIKRNV
jgi:cellulose synthase/poly-beta-1,6-N-acetylglucosamine synthase-like glycosyltransferase